MSEHFIILSSLAALSAVTLGIAKFFRTLTRAVRDVKDLAKELQGGFRAYEQFRTRRIERAALCEYLFQIIRQVNSAEQWGAAGYTELEANVEMTGPVRVSERGDNTVVTRRRRNLSRALTRSRDIFIVLEGQPGSGKSVALRTLAMRMLGKAARSRRVNVTIPLYVNLKRFAPGGPPDVNKLQEYILSALREDFRLNEVRFLNEEFERGLKKGTWLFLFDSFDEIPEILASDSYEHVVEAYSKAIAAFLSRPDGTACRGVIASRYFRRPRQAFWTRFRILPLTVPQQIDLLSRGGLSKPYLSRQ